MYVVSKGTSTNDVMMLYGQTQHDITITNNIESLVAVKQPGQSDSGGVVYEDNGDGERSVSLSVTFSKLKDDDLDAARKEVINKLKHQVDTTTLVYVGKTTISDEEAVDDKDDVNTMTFEGDRWLMKISTANTSFPNGSEISGTIDFVGAGVEPERVSGVFSSILAADSWLN